jgi:hypothetical protein
MGCQSGRIASGGDWLGGLRDDAGQGPLPVTVTARGRPIVSAIISRGKSWAVTVS